MRPILVTSLFLLLGNTPEEKPSTLARDPSANQTFQANPWSETVDVSKWSLEERAGQFLMVGYRSLEQIKKIRPGGVVLFSWAMKDVEQTRALTDTLKITAQANLRSPLFIATDHEGGKVLRLRKGMTNFPDAAALGVSADLDSAFRVGKAMGTELSALGINMNLAPVLDLGNARSFLENRVWGTDGQPVGEMTTAYIRGLHAARVLAVAKHFPGHGGSSQDSHFGLPIIEKSFDRVWKEDLLPFRYAIDHGVNAIMTAHVEIPAIVRGPASLAHEFVTDILRKKMGFRGLVLTDDLEMGGITKRMGAPIEDLALRAIVAGTDMILVVWSEEMQEKIIARIVKAVRDGEIPEPWFNQKVAHIQELKNKARLDAEGDANPFWRENLRRPENLELAKRVAEQGILWKAGRSHEIFENFGRSWDKSWVVVVPSPGSARFWKRSRDQDHVIVTHRRADQAEVDNLKALLKTTLKSGTPFVVMTGPMASSSEEVFQAIKVGLGGALKNGGVHGPVLWAHQGGTPVEFRWQADQLGIGIMSLNSGSAESLNAFSSYVRRESSRHFDRVVRE